jgi:hypothetical protein
VKIAKTLSSAAEGDYTWSWIRVFVTKMELDGSDPKLYQSKPNSLYDRTVRYVQRVRDVADYTPVSAAGKPMILATAVAANADCSSLQFPYKTGRGIASPEGNAVVYQIDKRLREKNSMSDGDYITTDGNLKCGYFPEISEMWCDIEGGTLPDDVPTTRANFRSWRSVLKSGEGLKLTGTNIWRDLGEALNKNHPKLEEVTYGLFEGITTHKDDGADHFANFARVDGDALKVEDWNTY